MPIYPYECIKSHKFEILRNMSDRQDTEICPECGNYAKQTFSVPFLNGVMYSDKTRELFRASVGHARAQSIRDHSDVERLANEFHEKFPHLQKPEAF